MAKNIKIDTFKNKVDFIRMVINSTDVFQLKTVSGEFINFYGITVEEQLAEGVTTDANDGEYVFIDKVVVVKDGVVTEVRKQEQLEEITPEENTNATPDNVTNEGDEEEPKEEGSIEEVVAKLAISIDAITAKLGDIEDRITKLEESGSDVIAKVKNLSKFSSEPIVPKSEKTEGISRFSFKRK